MKWACGCMRCFTRLAHLQVLCRPPAQPVAKARARQRDRENGRERARERERERERERRAKIAVSTFTAHVGHLLLFRRHIQPSSWPSRLAHRLTPSPVATCPVCLCRVQAQRDPGGLGAGTHPAERNLTRERRSGGRQSAQRFRWCVIKLARVRGWLQSVLG